MTVILPATARRAERIQRDHDAEEGTSRCTACWREGGVATVARTCKPYRMAEAILVIYRHQTDMARRPPARGRATVGVRYLARA